MVLTTQDRKLTPRHRPDNRNPARLVGPALRWPDGGVIGRLAILLPVALVSLTGCEAPPPPTSAKVPQVQAEVSGPYPNLSTVPNEAPTVSPPDQRQALMDQLLADHAAAKYLPPKPGTAAPASQSSN